MILAASSTVIDRKTTFERGTKQMKSGRRHDAGRHEHGQQIAFAAGPRVLDFTCRLPGDENEAPDFLRRKFDHPDFLEALVRPGRSRSRFRRSASAHHRRCARSACATASVRPTIRASGPSRFAASAPMTVRPDDRDDEPEARQRKRQIGVGIECRRQQRLDPGIDPMDHAPHDPQRDRHRADDDETGQKGVAKTRSEPPARLAVVCWRAASSPRSAAPRPCRRHLLDAGDRDRGRERTGARSYSPARARSPTEIGHPSVCHDEAI